MYLTEQLLPLMRNAFFIYKLYQNCDKIVAFSPCIMEVTLLNALFPITYYIIPPVVSDATLIATQSPGEINCFISAASTKRMKHLVLKWY